MTGMHKLNISILDGANEVTHWKGSPSTDGGELTLIDMSAPGGPPQFDFDLSGDDRTPLTFDFETLILGEDTAAQEAFVARYQRGTVFPSDDISGLPDGLDFVVQKANVKHSDEADGSTLAITLHEVGPTGGSGGGV